MVQPDTVIAWHRRGVRCSWTWKSRRRTGRPAVPREVRDLIRTMSRANPRWGAPRLHGELLKLGIAVSQTTVSTYMDRRRSPPSQSWRTFLTNHVHTLVSADFFVVPTATFRLLFVFVILAHDRRRLVHVAITAHPTAAWTAQQLREAFPWNTAPRYLLHDRDGIYDEAFRDTVRRMGVTEVRTAPRSPWQNPFVERLRVTRRGPVSRLRRPAAQVGAKAVSLRQVLAGLFKVAEFGVQETALIVQEAIARLLLDGRVQVAYGLLRLAPAAGADRAVGGQQRVPGLAHQQVPGPPRDDQLAAPVERQVRQNVQEADEVAHVCPG